MKTHVMIDLETMATDFNAAIVAIGAVVFNPETGEIGEGLECLISLDSSAQNGFSICCDTVHWWSKQSSEVQYQLAGTNEVRVAIYQFVQWLSGLCDKGDLIVWGKGPTFDLAILRHHFETLGYELPWHYWNERCVRTELDLGKRIGVDFDSLKVGVIHKAIDDALYQAACVSAVRKRMAEFVGASSWVLQSGSVEGLA